MEEGRRTLLGRWRRARGGRGRPGLPRGVRHRLMAATRRARPDAGRGAGAGERTATRRQAGPACAAGPKRRRRPSKVKMRFFKLFSRNFQMSVFKYPFEQENDFF